MSTAPYWTYFVGPFVGSFLAFWLARLYDANRRFKERLAAGNLALLVLKSQYNDFILFRRGFREDCKRVPLTGTEPVWMLLRPNFIVYGTYEFDYEGISFLFEGGAFTKAFEAIEELHVKHRDLVQMDKQRTETASTTQRLVAEASLAQNFDQMPAEMIIGPAFVAELDMLCVGLARRAERGESAYLNAFNMLREELRDNIKKTWHYRLGYMYRCRHDATVEQYLVQLKPRLTKGFNLDELPALPANLQSRLDGLA